MRFCGTLGPEGASVARSLPWESIRKSCRFFALENSLRIFAVIYGGVTINSRRCGNERNTTGRFDGAAHRGAGRWERMGRKE